MGCSPSSSSPAQSDAQATTTTTGDSNNSSTVLRIVAVNDVYELAMLPSLKTLIDQEKAKSGKTIVTLAGDFLMPSLLSALDHGVGIIDALNKAGVDYVCFGNHETDLSNPLIIERIKESNFTWINSNMRDFPYELPESETVELTSIDGTNSRKVGLIGVLYTSLPKSDYGGAVATMEPVMACCTRFAEKLSDHDCIIPLTHQDQADDEMLAQAGLGFPLILGGHDHFESYSEHDGCWVMKAGADAHKAVVIELLWTNHEAEKKPQVSHVVRKVSECKQDPELLSVCNQHMIKVLALDAIPLIRLDDEAILTYQPVSSSSSATTGEGKEVPKDAYCLDSRRVRYEVSSMGTMLATGVKEMLEVDCAWIESALIKGKHLYTSTDLFSMAALKKELPYPQNTIIVQLPGQAISDGIKHSRSKPTEECMFFAHTDNKMKFDSDLNCTHINNELIDMKKLYTCGLDWSNVCKYKNNAVIEAYVSHHPELNLPTSADAGIPAKVLLIQWFCQALWKKLPKFEEIDIDNNGYITTKELEIAYINAFSLDANHDGKIEQYEKEGEKRGVAMLINSLDKDHDGKVSQNEYENLLMHGASYNTRKNV